ncbi:MAG: SMP-30/gluconolactonase/LRE family protein [Fuerstiella sp.]
MFHPIKVRLATILTLLTGLTVFSTPPDAVAQPEEDYPTPPEAVEKAGVPKGTVHGPHEFRSQLFPGTVRQYWVYVPAQYNPEQPPCLMVVQDGLGKARGWRLPTVLDNMIHSGDVPVQLGVFVSPGVVPAAGDDAQARYNRSFEYDAMGDRYARFLIEELLPDVARSWRFSSDPDDRCIAGSSSGAICAFTAAWERPDAFRRVFSTVGTYVGLRGGNEYPVLIRKTEPKPIRIFLQDGSNDLDIYAGSWWHANQSMLSALQFAGYDVNHVWGEGGHNGRHGAAIIPEALRWLWRDYPEPVTNVPGRERRTNLLLDGEDWQLVSDGHRFTEGPAVASNGHIFFTDIPNNRIHLVDRSGRVSIVQEDSGGANGLMVGPDDKLYVCEGNRQQVARYTMQGTRETFLTDIKANDIVVLADGSGYVTEPTARRVWHFTSDGTRTLADEGIEFPNGVITSPDQTALTVSDTRGRFCYSFRIQPDGTLTHRQKYGWLHVTDDLQSGADGMAVDTEGRTYVATSLGLQVLDQPGRVHFIIRKPKDAWLSNVVFGGPDRNILYVTCGDSVYKRKINATGVDPWKPPITPPKPRL